MQERQNSDVRGLEFRQFPIATAAAAAAGRAAGERQRGDDGAAAG